MQKYRKIVVPLISILTISLILVINLVMSIHSMSHLISSVSWNLAGM